MEVKARQSAIMESELKLALNSRSIVPTYRPIVDLTTGQLQGFGVWRAGTTPSAE